MFEGDLIPAQRPSWNYRSEEGGGIVLDMFCHWRYVLDNLFGKVKAVSCLAATHLPERRDEAGKPYRCTAEDAAYGTLGSAVAGLRDCWIQPYNATPRPVWNPDIPNPIDFFSTWQKLPEQRTYYRGPRASSWRKPPWSPRGRAAGSTSPTWARPEMTKRVALVTGGTRGIGLASAEALAREGWDLAVCGVRGQEAVQPALQKLRDAGAAVLYVRADIGEDDALERLVSAVRERFGRLDALVNNAGVAPRERKDILEAARQSFDRLIRVNLRGPYFLTQAVARYMLELKGADPSFCGCIVLITSISAAVASVNRGEYCISKAGLSMASLLWATRLAGDGIAVYEVRPGIIKTDMTAGVTAKYDALIEQGLTLQRRWGTPQDVGKAVAMLARGDLAYSTGQVITVDGGLTVRRL